MHTWLSNVCILTPLSAWNSVISLKSVLVPQAPSLVRTVLEHGARVNTPRGDRRIPLHTAMRLPAGKKKLSIVSTLIVVGADIDRPGPHIRFTWMKALIWKIFHVIQIISFI